ncbi:MAG: type I DNA topoisomerase [Thermodesulfobacteriota bacterium]|nr:MAG: type I DNA topoisomerase [Thermodesulfobacteriota bacterium]
MGKSLVVVESPAKAKTINKFLGKDFTVMASVGHIKDLPKSKLGVDIEKGFEPQYVKIKGKEKTIRELKKAAKAADRILLAPDPDREGEAIAWHIAEEVDKEGKKTLRVLFNEITEKAVREAIKHPIPLDVQKYEAQQARRILDRLVGYQVSPILWEKVRRGLSAGRVQSVAVRLVCDREKEVMAFVPVEYWSITAELENASGDVLAAKLAKKNGVKIEVKTGDEAGAIKAELEGAEFIVSAIEKKEKRRNPAPPFTTSKLQQEASRKLGFSARKTMMIAQQLYEGVDIGEEGPVGLVTYIRTDSTRLSSEAVEAVRGFIAGKYGKTYLPEKPVVYKPKKKKKIQDAHEAIRPTYIKYPPETVKKDLTRDQFRLYTLIWNRFVACQMVPAIMDQTRVEVSAKEFLFAASGSVMKFPGFMAVYVEGDDEGAEKKEKEGVLPALNEGEVLKLLGLIPAQHFTQPPPRFTEASLVKELEENGIGRPSTYAAILSTIQERGYVEKEDAKLKPTELGFLVNDLLVENFPEILDAEFTAHMEDELDMIEEGRIPWREIMEEFYGPFKERLEKAKATMKNVKGEETPTDIVCEKCSKPMVIKWGRRGNFLACTGYPECKNTKDFTTDEEGKIKIVDKREETDEKCPECSSPMVVKSGRFGRFLACSRYPECKTTRPFSTGVACPEEGCGGTLVERRTKKGRTFYGCSNYPRCSHATWKLPKKD